MCGAEGYIWRDDRVGHRGSDFAGAGMRAPRTPAGATRASGRDPPQRDPDRLALAPAGRPHACPTRCVRHAHPGRAVSVAGVGDGGGASAGYKEERARMRG